MKKFVIIFAFLFGIPCYATCPIDSIGESVCTLPQFRQQVKPIFHDSTSGTNISAPSVKLQPLNRADPIEQMREPNNNLNYNSACQFGVCLPSPTTPRLPDGSDFAE